MKAILTICMLSLVLGLVSSPVSAIEYCKDFLETGNPGGWYGNSLKTFDDEWTMGVGTEVELDVWINDVPLPLLIGGFWIQYDPSKVSIVSVAAYDGYDLPGPWEVAFTQKVPDAGGPGTYMVAVAPPLMPASPDGDGDIIIAKVRFSCESEGDATITISTIPGFDTFVVDTIVLDPQITPNMVTIHQIIIDSDADGIPDHEDNCPLHPNSPELGICLWAYTGKTCLSDEECGYAGFCSLDQADDINCDCPSNFDCDYDVDGSDAARFKVDFGRSLFDIPCTNEDPCNGDFECDGDVDGTNAAKFKERFGTVPLPPYGYCLSCVDGVYQYDCSY